MTHRCILPGLAIDERGFDQKPPTPACLTTDEILELLLGSLPEDRREAALEHMASCGDCRVLFGSAAQALEDTGPVTPSSQPGVFQAGTLVANRYRVERFLARGGMGEVYAVRDQVLSERVALKTLRASPLTDAKAIRRLKSEALLSRRIGHANVCRIFDFGEHEVAHRETVYFLTMELVEGETLGARLRRSGRLPVEHVQIVLRQVLGGLAEAHALGIVHRDLKSDNIMLREPTATGAPVDAVVMDFGLAFRVDAEERLTSDTHALIGSAAYMSPEQVEGQRLTPATDVYALGVILFEILTGQLPFRAETPVSTALQRLHRAPPLPSSLRPELDPYWDHLVASCLQRVLARRLGSAREVIAVLDRPAALQEADSNATVSAPARSRRVSTLRSGVLAVVVSVGALMLLLWLPASAPRRMGTADIPPTPPVVAPPSAPVVSAPAPTGPAPAGPTPSDPAPESAPATTSPPATPSVSATPPTRPPSASPSATPPSKRPAEPRAPAPQPAAPPRKSPPRRTPAAASERAAAAAPGEALPAPAAPVPQAPAPSPLEPLPLDPEFPE